MRRRVVLSLVVVGLLAGLVSALVSAGRPQDTRAATAAALGAVRPPAGFEQPFQCTRVRSVCFRNRTLLIPLTPARATTLVGAFGVDVSAKGVKCVVPVGCTGTGRFHGGPVAFVLERAFPKPLRQAGTQVMIVPA